MTKVCTVCKTEMPINDFHRDRNRADGHSARCKACDRIKRNIWKKTPSGRAEKTRGKLNRRERNAIWWLDYRKSQSCSACGENDWRCLDAHHVDPSQKKYSIPHMVHYGMSLESIKHELQKCTTLCANCHRKLHFQE